MNIDPVSLLIQGSFLMVNKALLKYFKGDYDQVILLVELLTLSYHFRESTQMKTYQGWFFRSVEDIEESVCLNEYKQRLAIKALTGAGFIEVKRASRPAKRFFRVNEAKIQSLFTSPGTSASATTPSLKTEDKKIQQEQFYDNINESVPRGFEVYKKSIGNIKAPFAVFMYTWNCLYQTIFGEQWMWSPEKLGKLKMWFDSYGKEVDYNHLRAFFLSLDNTDHIIPKWTDWIKSSPEHAPSLREYDPRKYWSCYS